MHSAFGKKNVNIDWRLIKRLLSFPLAMCAYTVIVGDTLPHVLQALIPGIETWPILGFMARRSFVITFCTILISFPLSLYRDISKLAKTSAIAMLALVVIIIAVMIEGPRAPMEIRGDPDLVWSFVRPEVFQSIGVISFAFVCHHNSFLIFGSLQKPTVMIPMRLPCRKDCGDPFTNSFS